MGFLKKLDKIMDVIFDEDSIDNEKNDVENGVNLNQIDDSVEKGDAFETYVVNLFSEEYFKISEWTSDISRKHNRFVESDCNPDLVMRYNYKNIDERFCIECKFRSNLYKGKLSWSNHSQIERYKNYANEKDLPVFIVIGLGGYPDNPDRMFCIPLEEAKYPALYPSVFEKFERDAGKPFFYRDGMLS